MPKLEYPDPAVTNPWTNPIDNVQWEHDGDGWKTSSGSSASSMAAKVFISTQSLPAVSFVLLPNEYSKIIWRRESILYGDPSFCTLNGEEIIINEPGIYDFQMSHVLVQGDSINGFTGRTKVETSILVSGWSWLQDVNDPTQYEFDVSSGTSAGNPRVLIGAGGRYLEAGDIVSVARHSDPSFSASYLNVRDQFTVRKLS